MSTEGQGLRTLRDVLRFAVTRFNQSKLFFGHGQADAYDEAVFLLIGALQLPFDRLETLLDARVTRAEFENMLSLIESRIKTRKPIAYLLGEAWQQGCRFYVDSRVIVPRSFIGELLKERLAPWIEDPLAVKDVLDLGTGSGCLAVLAAHAFPNAKVDAADISTDALEVAGRNIAEHRLEDRITLHESNVFSNLSAKRYDLILSNPPYVPDASMQTLPQEYRHEPELALSGGADGLNVVRPLLRQARAYLKRKGILVCEVGGERAAVERSFKDLPLTWLTTSGGDDMVFLVRQDELP